jgi:putative flippase GtrA
MHRLRTFIQSFLNWATFRYAVSGVLVGLFTLGMPILLNAEFGLPLEACIPIIYVLGVTIQFTAQRVFVFRHVEEFALPMRRQILWYVVIIAIQYPLNAAATAVLPGVLGLSERIVYVGATLSIALLTLLFLRRNVFHARDELQTIVDSAGAHGLGPEHAGRPTPFESEREPSRRAAAVTSPPG